MTGKTMENKKFSEEEIDEIVTAQEDDESAWEQPVFVKKTKPMNISIPCDMAKRASFLAKMHREKDAEKWLKRIIQERIDLEETVFAQVKKEHGRISHDGSF